MAMHCSTCGHFLESTVKNPTVALSNGTFHYNCYSKNSKEREAKALAEAEAEAESRMEAEAKKLAKKLESRNARSAMMKARWAMKNASAEQKV